MKAKDVFEELEKLRNPTQATLLQRFFKTGPGQYGEGDIFLGIKVPEQRKVAKKYSGLSLDEVQQLLNSKVHEHRLTGLLILVHAYENGNGAQKKKIFYFYLKNTRRINNWDLVDVTSPRILGTYLLDKGKGERQVLYKLAKSDSIWERRIAIISTLAFIVLNKESKDTLAIAEILMKDEHDLIHKAVGWMLREVGKRCGEEKLEEFLKKHSKTMPRTMLRYSIERLSKGKKKHYMQRD